ncbi:MAG: hypothetical protein ACOC5K_01055 [Chloroflexota bacterium]
MKAIRVRLENVEGIDQWSAEFLEADVVAATKAKNPDRQVITAAEAPGLSMRCMECGARFDVDADEMIDVFEVECEDCGGSDLDVA